MPVHPSPNKKNSRKTPKDSKEGARSESGWFFRHREPLLSKEALRLAEKLKKDPNLARAFLIRAGILNKAGKLSENYCSEAETEARDPSPAAVSPRTDERQQRMKAARQRKEQQKTVDAKLKRTIARMQTAQNVAVGKQLLELDDDALRRRLRESD